MCEVALDHLQVDWGASDIAYHAESASGNIKTCCDRSILLQDFYGEKSSILLAVYDLVRYAGELGLV